MIDSLKKHQHKLANIKSKIHFNINQVVISKKEISVKKVFRPVKYGYKYSMYGQTKKQKFDKKKSQFQHDISRLLW